MGEFYHYTTHKEILVDLGRNFKDMEWDEASVIEWCQHVENRIVPNIDYMVGYSDVEINVENGRALIPSFAYKTESFSLDKKESKKIKGVGTPYIDVSDHLRKGKIYLNFVGMPVDLETGIPLILKGHEALCYWYCIQCAYTEKWLLGEIDNSRWSYISSMVSMRAVEVSQSLRHWTDRDFKRMHVILGSNIAHLKIF